MKNLIKGPDHMAFSVTDLDAMVHFYHEILGLELLKAEDYRAGKFPFMSVKADRMLIDLIPLKEAPTMAEGRQRLNHICLRLDEAHSLADVKTYLAENNIAVTGESKSNWGAFGLGPSIYINDPEGNSVELKTYP